MKVGAKVLGQREHHHASENSQKKSQWTVGVRAEAGGGRGRCSGGPRRGFELARDVIWFRKDPLKV